MIFDFHVHVGQFNERYFSPEFVCKTLKYAGITDFAFSSTSHIISDDKCFLLKEREKVLEITKNHAHLFQWLTPDMLANTRLLDFWLDKNVEGLKFQGRAYSWGPFSKSLEKIFAIAVERKLPILIHTGEDKKVRPTDYLKMCQKYKDVKVILGHGRPLELVIPVLRECPNTYVDTAFMPGKEIKTLCSLGYKKRILFGTDAPIPKLFYKSSLTQYLKKRILTVQKLGVDISNAKNLLCKN